MSIESESKKRKSESDADKKSSHEPIELWTPESRNELKPYFDTINGNEIYITMNGFTVDKAQVETTSEPWGYIPFTKEQLDSPIDSRMGNKSIIISLDSIVKLEDGDTDVDMKTFLLKPTNGRYISFRDLFECMEHYYVDAGDYNENINDTFEGFRFRWGLFHISRS